MNYADESWDRQILKDAGLEYADEYNRGNSAKVNREMRKVDQSDLYPIRGRFNATDRAIRRAQQYHRDGGESDSVGSYVNLVDHLIGVIVNDPRSL